MPSHNTYRLTWVSLTLGVGYLFTAAPAKCSCCSLPWTRDIASPLPFLTFHGDSSSRPLAPAQPWLLGRGVAPLGCRPEPWTWGSSSQPFLCHRSLALLAAASDLGRGVATLGQAFCTLACPSQPPAPPVRCIQGKEHWLRFAGGAVKRYPTPKVRETQVRR